MGGSMASKSPSITGTLVIIRDDDIVRFDIRGDDLEVRVERSTGIGLFQRVVAGKTGEETARGLRAAQPNALRQHGIDPSGIPVCGLAGVLKRHEVTISMDGKGRCMDNIFIERLWRSLKYEEVYLHAYGSVAQAKAGIGAWLVFYNEERQHQSHGYRTPRANLRRGPVDM